MFGVFFSILVVVALLSIFSEIVMRVRLTRRASRDKIAWWRRGGDEVAATYEEVFTRLTTPFEKGLTTDRDVDIRKDVGGGAKNDGRTQQENEDRKNNERIRAVKS